MCLALTRDHETARKSKASVCPQLDNLLRICTKTRILFVLFVCREDGVRVRRACRARQGAADAPRRTRRSLKSAHGADDAHRRRRFDMHGRISWSRADAKHANIGYVGTIASA